MATKKRGIVTSIKEVVLKDPSVSADEVVKQLRKRGFRRPSRSTVVGYRQDFLHSLRLLKEKGINIAGV